MIRTVIRTVIILFAFLFLTFFSGEFHTKPSLSFWPLLPCWHWTSSPLPCRLSVHLPRTEGGWWLSPLPTWSLLWQACISWAFRCSPLSCRVNTSPLLLFHCQSPHSLSVIAAIYNFHLTGCLWAEKIKVTTFVLLWNCSPFLKHAGVILNFFLPFVVQP